MPTLCWSSPLLKATADGLSLAVGIAHQLKLATNDEPVLKIQKFPPPESLDILSSSSILLRLTGLFEGKQIPTETLQQSSLVAYLLEYLKYHAAKLFIGNVSDPYVSADGTLELSIVSSRALLHPDELPVATATLTAINWSFAWKSKSTEDTLVNPFSPQHLLPVQNLVNSAVEKVLSRDFVRRYPLIFGSWRNSLGTEMDAFPQVAEPILNIIARSQNTTFQKQCRRILRSLRRSNNAVYDNSLETLESALGSLTLNDILVPPYRDDEQVLLASLQSLHRTLFRTERFKASTFITKSDDPLYSSDHHMLSPDTLLDYEDSAPFEDPNGQHLASGETAFTDLLTESESFHDTGNMGTLLITQFETLGPKEPAGTCRPFEANTDLFTLAGLDDDWESTGLQPNPTQREDSILDDDDLSCVALDLGDPLTGFPWNASACSDTPRFYDVCTAAVDQPVLNLDSDDEDMGEEEVVLDF